jgi:hypothetical protein
VLGAWAAATIVGFAVYLRLAQTRAVNSDGAAQALQAWDMLHGDPLLRGWTTSDVPFYTTELPQYLLVELVRGLGQDVVHVAAAMTYTLVVLLTALVAAGPASGREVPVRVAIAAGIMLAPQLVSGTNVLISSPDHIGTSVPLLLTWLVLDRVRPRWYVPVITSLLLAWAQVADSIVLIAGIIPLVAVCLFDIIASFHRAGPRGVRGPGGMGGARRDGGREPPMRGGSPPCQRPAPPGDNCAFRLTDPASGRRSRLAERWYEAALGGGALIAAGVAALILRLIHAAGGFSVRPFGTAVASLGEIFGHNLPIAAQCLLLLTGADFFGLPRGATTFFVVLHLAGAVLAAAGIALAAWRFRRGTDLVSQVLLTAIVVNVVVFVATSRVYAVSSAREIAPALPFAAALAGRQLAHPLLTGRRAGCPSARLGSLLPTQKRTWHLDWEAAVRRTLVAALCVIGAGYLAGLGLELTAPAAPPQAAQLTAWLDRHHLGTGLSGYWQASIVTLTSGDRVAVRPVNVTGGRVVPAIAEVEADWFDPAHSAAHYVVLFPGIPGYPGFTDHQAVEATFGKPARVYQIGRYTIWYWPTNLLSTIRH